MNIPSFPGPYFVGSNVVLDCEVDDGNPTSTTRWLRNSIQASTGLQHSFQALSDDNGQTYTCEANNVVDTISDSIVLQVYCETPK